MKKIYYILSALFLCVVATSAQEAGKTVVIKTNVGTMKAILYDDVPNHTRTFIERAKRGDFNGTLFTRVLPEFMIQGGAPDSKNAPAGAKCGFGDPSAEIPPEINEKYFHKKGALSAARQGDNVNPKKESSGCQFYIVTGKVYNDSTLLSMESQMNENKINVIFNTLAQKHMKEIYKMRKANDENGLYDLQEKLFAEAQEMAAKQPEFHFTPEQIEAYTTVGGTPHLDGEYTVFGEVVEGMYVETKSSR